MRAGSGFVKSYRTNRVTQARVEVHATSSPTTRNRFGPTEGSGASYA